MLRSITVLVCLLLAAPCLAAGAETVFLEELTSPELSDLVRAGKHTILIPIGGTEQNGPAMALGKHNVRVKALSQKIALALGDALVSPVIAYVPEGSVEPPTMSSRRRSNLPRAVSSCTASPPSSSSVITEAIRLTRNASPID